MARGCNMHACLQSVLISVNFKWWKTMAFIFICPCCRWATWSMLFELIYKSNSIILVFFFINFSWVGQYSSCKCKKRSTPSWYHRECRRNLILLFRKMGRMLQGLVNSRVCAFLWGWRLLVLRHARLCLSELLNLAAAYCHNSLPSTKPWWSHWQAFFRISMNNK